MIYLLGCWILTLILGCWISTLMYSPTTPDTINRTSQKCRADMKQESYKREKIRIVFLQLVYPTKPSAKPCSAMPPECLLLFCMKGCDPNSHFSRLGSFYNSTAIINTITASLQRQYSGRCFSQLPQAFPLRPAPQVESLRVETQG